MTEQTAHLDRSFPFWLGVPEIDHTQHWGPDRQPLNETEVVDQRKDVIGHQHQNGHASLQNREKCTNVTMIKMLGCWHKIQHYDCLGASILFFFSLVSLCFLSPYTYTHIMHSCTHPHTHICRHIHIFIRHACTHTCLHTCTHTHLHTLAHTHSLSHTLKHTHTHKQTEFK